MVILVIIKINHIKNNGNRYCQRIAQDTPQRNTIKTIQTIAIGITQIMDLETTQTTNQMKETLRLILIFIL